jgi:hypothetical protein
MNDTSTLVVMSADVAAYLMARGSTLLHVSSPAHGTTALFTLAHAKPEWVVDYQRGCHTPDTWVPPPLLLGMRRRVGRAHSKAQHTSGGEYEVPRP